AWSWLAWYQAHQDAQGFVTDYTVVKGQAITTGSMDSTDSYAGTFLLGVREAYRQRGEITLLRGLGTGIAQAVTAIEATRRPDGRCCTRTLYSRRGRWPSAWSTLPGPAPWPATSMPCSPTGRSRSRRHCSTLVSRTSAIGPSQASPSCWSATSPARWGRRRSLPRPCPRAARGPLPRPA